MGGEGQRIQTSRYKVSYGEVMYSAGTTVNTTLHCLNVTERVDLKSSHHKEEKFDNYI